MDDESIESENEKGISIDPINNFDYSFFLRENSSKTKDNLNDVREV